MGTLRVGYTFPRQEFLGFYFWPTFRITAKSYKIWNQGTQRRLSKAEDHEVKSMAAVGQGEEAQVRVHGM